MRRPANACSTRARRLTARTSASHWSEISRQALRAGEVIRRLRAFVADRAGSPGTRSAATGCSRTLVALARPDLRANDVRLKLERRAELAGCDGRPVQVQQVLINLFRNAIDATLQSGGAQREITLRALCTPGGVEISVHDHGPGLDTRCACEAVQPLLHDQATRHGPRARDQPHDRAGAWRHARTS